MAVTRIKLHNTAGRWELDASADLFILFNYFHAALRNYDQNIKLN